MAKPRAQSRVRDRARVGTRAPVPERGEAFARRHRAALAVGSLLLLGVVNVLWFSVFPFRTVMGDDLGAWALYSGHPSFQDLFLTASGGKYRPVFTAAHYVLFGAFAADYRAWVAFSIVFNFVNVCLVFALVRRLTRGDTLIAFLAGLLYITSRFSYYNILQLNGVMEALGIFFLLLILHVAFEFLRSDSRWPGFALAGLYLLITFTHERYIVLLPFLVLLVVFKSRLTRRPKVLLLGLMCVPPLLMLALESMVFHSTVLMGTGGQPITFDPVQVMTFMAQGLANMFWINAGPAYLSGIKITNLAPGTLMLVIVVGVSLAVVGVLAMGRILTLKDPKERRAELKGLVLWMVLLLSLLLGASITIRQEYRWLYAPFVVCLVYFCYQMARLPWRPLARYGVLVALVVMAVGADFYYKQHEGNVFFLTGEAIADSTYDATMGRYGLGMSDRTVYVEKARDLAWVLGGTGFLAPYLGADYQKIVWVDDLNAIDLQAIDPANSLFLRMDWSQNKMVDVTSQVLHR
jgi:hypothetical protein